MEDKKVNIKSTREYFNLTIGELLEQNEYGYTKEENLLYDKGLSVTFFDDMNEYIEEKEAFIHYLSKRELEVFVELITINERIAVVAK